MNEETARVRLENFAFFLKKTTNILHSNYFYNHLIWKACTPRHRIVISPPVFAQSVWLYTVELRMPSVTRCHYTMSSKIGTEVKQMPWNQHQERNQRGKCFVNKTKPLCKKKQKTQKAKNPRVQRSHSEIRNSNYVCFTF